MNFWDKTHPLAAAAGRLFEQLVPASGKCDTLQGECLRASSKIGYDWYNNGWGCNNWSGAVLFLFEHAETLANKRTPAEYIAFEKALNVAHGYSHGESVDISDDRADAIVTAIHAFIVQCVLDNPVAIANEADMWDLREPDAPYEEEEEDDSDDEY